MFADGPRAHRRQATLTFAELVWQAYHARVSLSATGFYATPKINYDVKTLTGRPFFYFCYGAAVSEVIVDSLTGESRLLRVDILHDVGRSLNPAIDLGQVEGGFVQGVGWLTSEELWWDERGHAHDARAVDVQDSDRVRLARDVQREPASRGATTARTASTARRRWASRR